MKKKFEIVWVLITLLFLQGCSKSGDVKKSFPSPVVEVVDVERDLIVDSIKLVGDLKALDKVIVYSKVPGKLKNYLVKEGDAVKKGDVLAFVDRDQIGFQFQHSPVKATLDGIVAKVHLDGGENVLLDTPVLLIVNLDEMRAKVSVGEKYSSLLTLGQKSYVKVDAYPNEVFSGVIYKKIPLVDVKTRTFPIEISIDNNHHKLLPGMFAKIEIVLKEFEDAIVIDEESIVRVKGETFVFIVEDSIAKERPISLGIRRGNKVQVVSGLDGSERIIKSGHHKVRNNSKVVEK